MLSVIMPVFNEAAVIEQSYKRLKSVLDANGEPYEIIMSNDGSRDESENIIKVLMENDKNLKLITLSRNFGQQAAISAGLDNAAGDAIVIIDADMQDPPELIGQLTEKWREGYDIVYGIKSNRESDSFLKRNTAKLYYRIISALTTECKIPQDSGDFRLLDRKVVDALKSFPEHNRYLRGIYAWMGFKSIGINFTREERAAGETKYTVKKMLKLAADGFFSFSSTPIKLVQFFSVIMSILTVGLVLLLCLTDIIQVSGTIILAVMLDLVVFSLSILSIYLGRIYDEVRNRPMYIIREKNNF